MKRLIAILFVLGSLISQAQIKATDTTHFIDRTSQWWTTNPYIVTGAANFKLRRILLHPAQYAAASLPTGSNGAIIWDTDSLRLRYYNGTDWVLITPDGGGGVAGVTSFNARTGPVTFLAADVTGVGGYVNGLNAFGANSTIGNSDNFSLSIRTNNAARINISNAGAVSLPDGSLTVGGTTNGVFNLQSSSASTRGSLDLSSNNPTLNTATGIWLFRQSGTTMGLYNSVGWFFGGGSTPAGAIVTILAGTTSVAPFRLNSGPLTTTPVAGNIEFLTDKFYASISTGPARKELSLNDIALTTGRVVLTTTNGRLTDLADGSSGQVLTTNGSATYSWSPAANIYTTDGTISANRTVTSGSLAQITFSDFPYFNIKAGSIRFQNSATTQEYGITTGSGFPMQIGWTHAGAFNDGIGILIDTNNNVAVGKSAAVTTSPLFAAGTSLWAGNGLLSEAGNFYHVRAVTTTGNILLTDYFITVDATGGNVTLTLPAASTAFGNAVGIQYVIKRIDNSGNTITIQRAGSDTIDGGTSVTLTTQWEVKELQGTSTSTWNVK